MLVTLCGGSAWEKAETAAFLQKKLKVEVCCGMELMIPLDTPSAFHQAVGGQFEDQPLYNTDGL